jgi:transaldolase
MNRIHLLHQQGQSLWLDFIQRDLLQSGELRGLITADEIRGVTSNPTIFQAAIASSELYASSLQEAAGAGSSPAEVFETIAIEDIRAAADLFLPLYDRLEGEDGYVSIEVNPELAGDTLATLAEVRRLWSRINRPNVMIKIPATEAGIPAIEQGISEGINVNVTLIFALDRYTQVMEAYLRGQEARAREGRSIDHVASVASFFVSRVDTKVDARLEQICQRGGLRAERAQALLGGTAIANAKLAYAQFKAVFDTERFNKLQAAGARVQRPLWASTSTKNPHYPDTYYVDNLIGPQTVNTVPPSTLNAFREHGKVEGTIERGLSEARGQVEGLESLGISLSDVTEELEQEGVRKFANSYRALLDSIRNRVGTLG